MIWILNSDFIEMTFWVFFYHIWRTNSLKIKLRHCEKATKFETIFFLFWRLLSKSADLSKQEEDCFKFLLPFQKSWTLTF